MNIIDNKDPFNPLVSIVVPSRNEAQDIARTLDAILAIEYEPKEIIVVDDSTDQTPEIVAGYGDRGVRLIHREQNRNGCCGARNLGMQSARGEIIVLMNADNRPRPDFLRRLLPLYQEGADFVVVRSNVLNRDNIWAQYIYASGSALWERNPNPKWSEGFSCRRSAAQAVGYIPGDFPVPFCRDYMFPERLERSGFQKRVDLSIPMDHISPDTFKGYWQNQVWRGTFSAPHQFYFREMALWLVALRELARAGRTVLLNVMLLPRLWRAFRIGRHVTRRWRSVLSLYLVGAVQDAATVVGGAKGLLRLIRTVIVDRRRRGGF